MHNYNADCNARGDEIRIGEVYHVVRNNAGGSTSTPIARYFVWRPTYLEGFNEHWRIDCYVREHTLSPDAKTLGLALRDALNRESLCDSPCWVSWHRSNEIGGEPMGEVFDFE